MPSACKITKNQALKIAREAFDSCARQGRDFSVINFRTALRQLPSADIVGSEAKILTTLQCTWSDLLTSYDGASGANGGPFRARSTFDVLQVVPTPSAEPIRLGKGVEANALSVVLDGRAAWNHLVDRFNTTMHKNEITSFREINIDSDKPIGIVFLGDLHIGSASTDYPRLAWLLSKLRDPNLPLYTCSIGDVLDSMVWANVRFEQQKSGVDMEEEIAAAAWWLDEVSKAGKLLGLCAGNHDLVSGKMSGNDHLNNVLQRLSTKDIPYHPYELVLTVILGKVPYQIKLRHKVNGNSSWNPAHGVAKAHRFDDHDSDIIVSGHTHRSGAQEVRIHGKTRWGIQVGAYKRSELDDYAKENGWPNENIHPDYTAILWPKTRKIEVLPTETALELLDRRVASKPSSKPGMIAPSRASGKIAVSTKSASKAKKRTKSSSRAKR